MDWVLEFLSILAIFSSFLVVTAPSTVISILWLVAVFLFSAFILSIKGLTYVGLTYVIVYIGAIAILFLFVVQLLDQREANNSKVTSFNFKNLKHSFSKISSGTFVPKVSGLTEGKTETNLFSSVSVPSDTMTEALEKREEKKRPIREDERESKKKPQINNNILVNSIPLAFILGIIILFSILKSSNTFQEEGLLNFNTDTLFNSYINIGLNTHLNTLTDSSINNQEILVSSHNSGLDSLSLTNQLKLTNVLVNTLIFSPENFISFKGHVTNLGLWLYTIGYLPIVVISIILLLSMIGPIALCWKK